MQIIFMFFKICTFTVLSFSNTKAERKKANLTFLSFDQHDIYAISFFFCYTGANETTIFFFFVVSVHYYISLPNYDDYRECEKGPLAL